MTPRFGRSKLCVCVAMTWLLSACNYGAPAPPQTSGLTRTYSGELVALVAMCGDQDGLDSLEVVHYEGERRVVDWKLAAAGGSSSYSPSITFGDVPRGFSELVPYVRPPQGEAFLVVLGRPARPSGQEVLQFAARDVQNLETGAVLVETVPAPPSYARLSRSEYEEWVREACKTLALAAS